MDSDEFQLLMKARKNVYDLLRCLFLQEPTPEFLEALQQENFLDNMKGCHPDLDEGIGLFSTALASPDFPRRANDLKEEFTRLFIGPLPMPLSESVYRSAEGLLQQDAVSRVQGKYFEAGVLPNPRQSLPADHIGAELEFIYFLCRRAVQEAKKKSREPNLRIQKRFFEDHLNAWVPALCDRLFQEAQSPYFKGLAKLTQGFIAWDYEEIIAQFFSETESSP